MNYSQLLSSNSVAETAVLLRSQPVVVTAAKIFAASAAADICLQMFDAASAADVTVGTTVPTWVVLLDSGAGPISLGDGLPNGGLVFNNGLVVACTTTPTGNTGSAAHVRIAIQ